MVSGESKSRVKGKKKILKNSKFHAKTLPSNFLQQKSAATGFCATARLYTWFPSPATFYVKTPNLLKSGKSSNHTLFCSSKSSRLKCAKNDDEKFRVHFFTTVCFSRLGECSVNYFVGILLLFAIRDKSHVSDRSIAEKRWAKLHVSIAPIQRVLRGCQVLSDARRAWLWDNGTICERFEQRRSIFFPLFCGYLIWKIPYGEQLCCVMFGEWKQFLRRPERYDETRKSIDLVLCG